MTGRASINTVSTPYLHALFDHVQGRGLAPADLWAGDRFDPEDRDGRVTEAQAAEWFDRAAVLLDDPALGLHVGEAIRPGHYGALGYVAMNCATLGEALDSLRRYQSLVIDIGEVGLQIDDEALVLSWYPETERPYRQLAEFNLAGLLSFTRWVAGREARPLWMELAYPAPPDQREQQRIFGCPLRFDTRGYRLALARSWLGAPLVQPDPAMRELMQRVAEQQLRALPRTGEDVLARARGLIARRLKHPPVELEWVAGQLAISPRSLQRRLADGGMSFSQLVEQVKRQLAERYLSESGMSLTDIAFLLGYSEQSAFQRAFKRWTARTPAQYRAEAAAAGSRR